MIFYDGQCVSLEDKSYLKKKTLYSNNIITFDIETSSCWYDGDKVIGDRLDISEKEYLTYQPLSICYLWACYVDGVKYYGRDLEKAVDLFKVINAAAKETGSVTIFIHNLAFEFQFLLNYLSVESCFARSAHHVMKCKFKELPYITFRCSYFMLNLSLEKWGEQLGLKKNVGDLDYINHGIPRTMYTKLTDTEIGYQERDVEVVAAGVEKELKTYINIEDIPLTNTGKVRKEVRSALNKRRGYARFVASLLPKNFKEYQQFIDCYWGAYTHANMFYIGVVMDKAYCNDFASSYIYSLLCFKYPMTAFIDGYYNPKKLNDFAYIVTVELKNIKPKLENHYLSSSKCLELDNCTYDNGRVISADRAVLTCTGEDFEMLKYCYSFNFKIKECKQSAKWWLPIELISILMKYYKQKTSLKNVDDDLYIWSKSMLNACYGMMCTSLLNDDVVLNDNNEWEKQLKTVEDIDEFLKGMQERPKRNVFLSPYWGCWCTAISRVNLWTCITGYDIYSGKQIAESNDHFTMYCDTDSIKSSKDIDFSWYNDMVYERIKTVCRERDLDINDFEPTDRKGNKHRIGIFDKEDPYDGGFRTWGAKKYAYIQDGKLHITISGVPKGAAVSLKNLEEFEPDYKFERDLNERYNITNGVSNYLTYVNDMPRVIVNKGHYDEYHIKEKYGVNLRRKSYQMGITGDLAFLLMRIQDTKGLNAMTYQYEH